MPGWTRQPKAAERRREQELPQPISGNAPVALFQLVCVSVRYGWTEIPIAFSQDYAGVCPGARVALDSGIKRAHVRDMLNVNQLRFWMGEGFPGCARPVVTGTGRGVGGSSRDKEA